MAEGFGSGPEARECSGTQDMGQKRAEAGRSSVARRRRQGDGIEQRWDGWGSDEVQPASVGSEMVRSSAVTGQGVLWRVTPEGIPHSFPGPPYLLHDFYWAAHFPSHTTLFSLIGGADRGKSHSRNLNSLMRGQLIPSQGRKKHVKDSVSLPLLVGSIASPLHKPAMQLRSFKLTQQSSAALSAEPLYSPSVELSALLQRAIEFDNDDAMEPEVSGCKRWLSEADEELEEGKLEEGKEEGCVYVVV
ncbi:hypothetical protein BKA70DRAFT_1220254 [Coprinopsis sp. MPI-PUGE-AT-0042]|nr:hypothetical protein BKA70DRAFT_1220254 [Coprinopsis sp. MPI-PUGE-AT-0042]